MLTPVVRNATRRMASEREYHAAEAVDVGSKPAAPAGLRAADLSVEGSRVRRRAIPRTAEGEGSVRGKSTQRCESTIYLTHPSQIHSADELVLTELILENVLAEYEPEEIVALLSAFVFQEKTENVPTLTPRLEKGKNAIVKIAEKVNDIQILHQVIQPTEESNDFASEPRFGLAEVVYEWAKGMSFNRITDLTDVMEGTIVRTITRLDETCREVKNAAKLVGDPSLYSKMQEAQEQIKRDVIFAASLYM